MKNPPNLPFENLLRFHPKPLIAHAALCTKGPSEAYNSRSAWVVIFGVELCNDPGRRGDYADLAAVRAGASVAMVHRNIGDGRKR